MSLKYFFICALLYCSCTDLSEKSAIVEAMGEIPQGLDPARHTGISEVEIYHQIYEPLLKLDNDKISLNPCLAKSWQTVDGYTSFEFRLREDVYYHDGSHLDAESVCYSFLHQIQMDPYSPLFNLIDTIWAAGPYTLKIHLKSPYVNFLYTLTSPYGLKAVSEKILRRGGAHLKFELAGTGPYQFDEVQDKRFIQLVKFDKYREEKTGPDKIVFKFVDNFLQIDELFDKKEIDVLYGIPGFSIDRLKWQGKIEYEILSPISTNFLGFNTNNEPFNKLEMRRAILHSLNIPEFVLNIQRGNSKIASGPLPEVFSRNFMFKQGHHDLQKAKSLMMKVNYHPENKINFMYPRNSLKRKTNLEYIKFELGKMDLKLNMIPFDNWDEFNAACKSDSSQLFWSSWQTDVLGDPENFLYSLFHSQSEFNFFNYKNERVDHWLEVARREPTRGKRNILYEKIVQQILNDTPAVFLYHVIPHYAYNSKKIRSLPVNPYGFIEYQNVILTN